MKEDLVEVELPREVIAPRLAREVLRKRFGPALGHSGLDTARLLVTELVTNAVVHGRGRITLRVRLDEEFLFVEVGDEGAGLEPAIRERDFRDRDSGGHGLRIVDADSSRWGVHENASRVWFELERPGPRLARPITRTPAVEPCREAGHPHAK